MFWIKNKKGFTLIEVIIVIAVLAILSMIAIPRFSGFIEIAREARDEASAAAIGRVVMAYMESEELTAVPDYSDLPGNLVDSSFTFFSLKYGGVSRNKTPELGGTAEVVIVSGNSEQAYPK